MHTSALLRTVHVVAGVVPSEGAPGLHQPHPGVLLLDVMADVLDELNVAKIHIGDFAILCHIVESKAGLGVDVVVARLLNTQLPFVVLHTVEVSLVIVPFDGHRLRLAFWILVLGSDW